MALSFFLGLQFGLILIVLGIEFYFCIFNRYIEKEIENIELLILVLITLLCMIFSQPFARFNIGLWAIFPLPVAYFSFRILEQRGINLEYKNRTERKLRKLQEKAKRNPNFSQIWVEIGDIYFTQMKYDVALSYYYKARSIQEDAEVIHKIKIAEREDRLQKRKMWICSKCGRSNIESAQECIECGNIDKPLQSIKQDLLTQKKEIIRWIIKGFYISLILLFIIIVLSLLKTWLSDTAYTFFALCLSLFFMWLLWRTFWTRL